MIDFPASPTLGQQFTAAGVTWVWDGAKWVASGLSPTIVPGIRENRIINGDMRIDQRNNGNQGTATGVYTVDRWQYSATQASVIAWQRFGAAAGTPFQMTSFNYCLNFAVLTTVTPIAGSNFSISQPIEADMIGDLTWGTPQAQPVTLSFWALATVGGTYSGAIRNAPAPATRSYPFTFNLPATTWTKVVVNIPGDTGGAWVLAGNQVGLYLNFDLGCGSTFRGPAGAWASANYWGANGAVSHVANAAGANFQITGVKLEVGSVATPFPRQTLAKSLADCQRYYSVGSAIWAGYNTTSGSIVGTCPFPVTMRAPPTLTAAYNNLVNIVAGNIVAAALNQTSFYNQGSGSSVGQTQWQIGWTASAEL